MISKKRTLFIGLLCALMLFFTNAFLYFGSKPRIDVAVIQESAFIEFPSKYNHRQTKNDCGPFSVAAAASALTGKEVNPASFVREIGWRLPNNYTLPWGLERQLQKNSITIEKPNFHLLTDAEKITLIRQYLSLGKPIIILGERDHYEHYITLLGFNARINEFHIYDSLQASSSEQKGMTIDENGFLPGNTTLNSQELLNFWRDGGRYGLWNWYGLVAG